MLNYHDAISPEEYEIRLKEIKMHEKCIPLESLFSLAQLQIGLMNYHKKMIKKMDKQKAEKDWQEFLRKEQEKIDRIFSRKDMTDGIENIELRREIHELKKNYPFFHYIIPLLLALSVILNIMQSMCGVK